MNRLLRVGLDVTPSDSQLAGISRYTRDLSAALGRTPGVHVERLTGHDSRPSAMERLTRRAGRRLAYYPAVLDRTATRRDVDVLHCPGQMIPVHTSLPLVVTVHDLTVSLYPELCDAPTLAYPRLIRRAVAAGAWQPQSQN